MTLNLTTENERLESKPAKISFQKYKEEDFFPVVKERVENYFKRFDISQKGDSLLYIKVLFIAFLYLGSYFSLLFGHLGLAGIMLAYSLIGISKGLLGFNIIHDALHGAFFRSPTANRFIGYWFDFNGTSSYIWKITHNVMHHTFTNIPGHDHDIDKATLLRLSPRDELLWFHRYQHIYSPILYSLICLNWVLYSDYLWFFKSLKTKTVSLKEAVLFFSLKALNLFFFLILPLLILENPFWQIIIGYVCMHIAAGFMISIVFQLGHIVEGVVYLSPDEEGKMANNWAKHELLTTSNFATNNRLLTAAIGGLNFQIEHHLFPYISHIHYREISKIVRQTAEEFNIPYNEVGTFREAIQSHFRTLKNLGSGKI